ncbi:MAG TPA: choice-of-anchor Q domain-containing protein [Pyrinomonadaceae bacterium]|nr:choice-of-anchor Q domain-containing protein [Pyrinomonadaceae bacterium]
MKTELLLIVIFLMCFSVLPAPSQVSRNPKVFTVNSTADTFDAAPGNGACADAGGQCTLRAAIAEANASPLPNDAIIFALSNPSTIDLTLGEMPLQGQYSIIGPGPDRLTIQRSLQAGTPDFRLFRMQGGGNIDIHGVTFRNGKATLGGAFYVDTSTLRLHNVVVADNQATDGGGVYSLGGSLRVTSCLFHSNTATGSGGAILLAAGTKTYLGSLISNTTITNNHGQVIGAIANYRHLDLENSTITNNTSVENASGVYNSQAGSVNVLSTIIGNNTMPQFTLSGAFVSGGHNIITDARNSTGFSDGNNGDRVGINNSIDPLLGPLADNGGGIQTRALLPGSIAIDAGTGGCSLGRYEQRVRYNRCAGNGVDIGAFELNASNEPQFISFYIPLAASNESGAFYANTPVILIDPVTGERRHSIVNLKGEFTFYDVDYGVISVIEVRSKRRLAKAVIPFSLLSY